MLCIITILTKTFTFQRYRYLTLFKELALLKEFEKSENVLADRVDAKLDEKTDMQTKVGAANNY